MRVRDRHWRAVLRFVAVAAGAMLMAACGTAPPAATPLAPAVNLSGFPPAFREGHADGCNSARGRQVQDAERMKADALYAQGWRDGNTACRRK